jgi:hypothetical protein
VAALLITPSRMSHGNKDVVSDEDVLRQERAARVSAGANWRRCSSLASV